MKKLHFILSKLELQIPRNRPDQIKDHLEYDIVYFHIPSQSISDK